jgi:hypothetical protein
MKSSKAYLILGVAVSLSAFHPIVRAFSPLASTTYESYQTYHLDPLTDEFETEAPDLLPDATRSKASDSMEYWNQQFADARERLRGMTPLADAAEFDRTHPSHAENWIHYRKALEALAPHHRNRHSADDRFHWPKHVRVTSWEDYSEMVAALACPAVDATSSRGEKGTTKGNTKEKQSKANAFWQAKYREEKMREHMHSIEGEAEESPQYRFNEHSHYDTWGHYKHDFIDSLPPPKSIEQELEDLRQQASRFKALAIAEVIGHALAEEALHEAQQRAESCEIAEAVLLGAAANRE